LSISSARNAAHAHVLCHLSSWLSSGPWCDARKVMGYMHTIVDDMHIWTTCARPQMTCTHQRLHERGRGHVHMCTRWSAQTRRHIRGLPWARFLASMVRGWVLMVGRVAVLPRPFRALSEHCVTLVHVQPAHSGSPECKGTRSEIDRIASSFPAELFARVDTTLWQMWWNAQGKCRVRCSGQQSIRRHLGHLFCGNCMTATCCHRYPSEPTALIASVGTQALGCPRA
jgi:hypothetical protein